MGAANLSEDGVAAEDTAFRAAERVYRRRRDAAGTGRRARQALLRTRPLDLVAVLDFSAPPPAADGAAGTAARGGRGVGDAVLLDGLSFSAYALRSRPGLVVLPRVLSDAEQARARKAPTPRPRPSAPRKPPAPPPHKPAPPPLSSLTANPRLLRSWSWRSAACAS